jgi:hypothetical protein
VSSASVVPLPWPGGADAAASGAAPVAAPVAAPDGPVRIPASPPGPGEVPLADAAYLINDLDAWLAVRRTDRKALARLGMRYLGFDGLELAGVHADLILNISGGMDEVSAMDRLQVLAVSGGSARRVFDQTTHLDSSPDGLRMRGRQVQVSVFVLDGRALVVREDDGTCADALAAVHDAPFRARVVAMCSGIGRHSWNGARFARVGPP